MKKFYYFDTEKYCTDFQHDKNELITVQYQKIDIFSGDPIGKLIILKRWEMREEEIVKRSLRRLLNPDFIPVGRNIGTDIGFVKSRALKLGWKRKDLESIIRYKEHVNVMGAYIMPSDAQDKELDKLYLKSSQVPGYSEISMPLWTRGVSRDGTLIKWYENKEYWRIIAYIKAEAETMYKNMQIALGGN